jgi:hypothetical protein
MIWDVESSGYLDTTEIYAGIERYCEAKGLTFDSRSIGEIFAEADLNGHSQLDAQEFSVFLTLCCQRIEEIQLNDLAIFMKEQLLEILLESDDGSLKDGSDHNLSKLIGSFMTKLNRIVEERKRMLTTESFQQYRSNSVSSQNNYLPWTDSKMARVIRSHLQTRKLAVVSTGTCSPGLVQYWRAVSSQNLFEPRQIE